MSPLPPTASTPAAEPTINRNILLGFVAALLILIGAGTTAALNIEHLDELYGWVDHTHQVVRHVDHAANAALRMQASMRGYLATGRSDLLAPYTQGTSDLRKELTTLRGLTGDNPVQQHRLDRLAPIARELEQSLDALIAERRGRGAAALGDTTGFVRSEHAVSQFRAILRAMDAEEDRLLSARVAQARAMTRESVWTGAAATALAAAIVTVAVLVLLRDQRRRIRAEIAAQETAGRYEDLYNEAPCGYHSIALDGTILSINDTELRWLGYMREEVVGRMKVSDWMAPESVVRFRRNMTEFVRTGHVRGIEFEWRRKDGSLLPVVVNADAIYDRDGAYVSSRATVFDNTAPVQARQALRESEERLRMIFEGVHEYGIILLDPAGRIVQWNPGAERIHGYTAQEIAGHAIGELYPEAARRSGAPETQLETARRTGRYEDEGWRRRKNGSTFWANAVVSALAGPNGEPRGFVKVTRDLTERRRTEQQIQQLNADLRRRAEELEATNRELEAFSYSVSHDLRAPLRHIDGFAGLLLSHPGAQLDAEGRRYVEIITRAAKRMGTLIDNLLAFSRMGRKPLNVEPVNQDELVASVISEGRYEDHPIEWRIGPLPVVWADGAMLRQVWANLVSNAVKYSGKQPHPRIEIGGGADETGTGCVCHVRDNGVGFDMAFANKLFGVFQRLHGPTEFEGTGIGLANVRRIIERHGGRTWAEGRPGEGATFFFSLPLHPHSQSPHSAP